MSTEFSPKDIPCFGNSSEEATLVNDARENIFDEICSQSRVTQPTVENSGRACDAILPAARGGNDARVGAPAPIGTATMERDGTIVLQLRAMGPGILGHATMRYQQSHPNYKEVFRHIGGIVPGQTRKVLPFDQPAQR